MTLANTHPSLIEFTVSELSSQIKMAVEGAFPRVRIRGEISGFKRAPSGHIYMNLKDENAVLACVCWKGNAARFRFKPEEGMEVVATGTVTTYAGQSKYQLVVDNLEPAGLGALMALLEKRKQKLAAEGLFDSDRKQSIPYLPSTIGVVTSPTGAVIKDILHRINERFPTHVLVWPVLVQGEKAAEQIAAAIKGFNRLKKNNNIPRPDVLIVARGGGSVEDLWPFNEEAVVRSAAKSSIPLISAIGHETDFTLIDYAADLRAPTPTAAAEMAVPVKSELLLSVDDLDKRSTRSMHRFLEHQSHILHSLARALPNPKRYIEEKAQRLDNIVIRLDNAVTNLLKEQQQNLTMATRLLESYHYKRVLERGFALVRNKRGAVVKSATALTAGTNITVELADGSVDATIPGSPAKKPKGTAKSKNQGNLF